MENPTKKGIITLRSVFGKVKEYHFQPLKQKNGMPHPFVKRVRYNPDGSSEMILSDKELNDENYPYFIPEDLEIVVSDGTTFNLDNPLEYNKWMCIRDSELIVPDRFATDENGNSLIDGDKKRYGLAELWVDVPGEESERSVNRRKLITKAWTYIENDSAEGRLTKTKLLGKIMRNAPDSDVQDFLYQKAEREPNVIIELYTSSDMALKLLIIDIKERGIIWNDKGLWTYADNVLGATDEAMIIFFKNPSNKAILDVIKAEAYPEYAQMIAPTVKKEAKE